MGEQRARSDYLLAFTGSGGIVALDLIEQRSCVLCLVQEGF